MSEPKSGADVADAEAGLPPDEDETSDEVVEVATPRRTWVYPLLGGIVLLLLAAVAMLTYLLLANAAPSEDSAEVGFARDMMEHHAQAVDMSFIIRDQSTDPEMRTIGYDIITGQQAQIGMMDAWLNQWGRPYARSAPRMAWMGMPTTGLMPGMATQAELDQLRVVKGEQADILFLNLMIKHHQGGVSMAQAVLARNPRPEIRQLAQGIVNQQQAEIATMQNILQRKGAAPAPTNPGMGGMPMPTP